MSMKKTLGAVVLGLALSGALVSSGLAQEQRETKEISGDIINVDEDSVAYIIGKVPTTFEFEHIRVLTYSEEEKLQDYKLILPGPSNYQKGDIATFEYVPISEITYRDLVKMGLSKDAVEDVTGLPPYITALHVLQKGYFNIDGVIIDHKFTD